MPTYDYQCPDEHTFEVFQSIKDDPTAVCPICGKPAKRLLSAGAGLMFKGSGFYITDYKKKSETKTNNKIKNQTSDKKDHSESVKKKTP